MAALPCAKEIIDGLAQTQGNVACAIGSVPLYVAAGAKPTENHVERINRARAVLDREVEALLAELNPEAENGG